MKERSGMWPGVGAEGEGGVGVDGVGHSRGEGMVGVEGDAELAGGGRAEEGGRRPSRRGRRWGGPRR